MVIRTCSTDMHGKKWYSRKAFFSFLFTAICSIGYGQNVPVIKYPQVEKIINSEAPDIVVVNFWATWCGPCVKELPHFDELAESHPGKVKVYLISLDFVDEIQKVKSFIKRKQVKSQVLLLDEVDYNSWIDKVDPSWPGAIPATLIRNTKTGQRKFIAKEVTRDDLELVIGEFSKN